MSKTEQRVARLRLADLLAALSVVTDPGHGQPPEDAMRACLLATRLAHQMRLGAQDVADVYYTTLLRYVGCTASAHEEAALFGGDEIGARAAVTMIDLGDPREALSFWLFHVARDSSPLRRARVVGMGLARGRQAVKDLAASNCEVGAAVARRVGLEFAVQQALQQLYERWDGKGEPRKLAGEDLALPMRFVQVATQALVFARVGGPETAVAVVHRRAGGALDPVIAAAFLRYGPALLAEIDSADVWKAVVEAEPEPFLWIPDARLDAAACAFADMVDLKLPFTRGHSAGVAELAEGAARVVGLGEAEAIIVRRASLFHDLGRLGVPNGIWEKVGPLTEGDWEHVRLHPYHTERILARSPALAPLARIAGMHHERQDGSGYHRQLAGAGVPFAARIVAAADAYQAMTVSVHKYHHVGHSATGRTGEPVAPVHLTGAQKKANS